MDRPRPRRRRGVLGRQRAPPGTAASLGRFLPAATPVPAPRRRTSQRRFPKDQYFAADEQKGTAR
jgi:hypothetical protein